MQSAQITQSAKGNEGSLADSTLWQWSASEDLKVLRQPELEALQVSLRLQVFNTSLEQLA